MGSPPCPCSTPPSMTPSTRAPPRCPPLSSFRQCKRRWRCTQTWRQQTWTNSTCENTGGSPKSRPWGRRSGQAHALPVHVEPARPSGPVRGCGTSLSGRPCRQPFQRRHGAHRSAHFDNAKGGGAVRKHGDNKHGRIQPVKTRGVRQSRDPGVGDQDKLTRCQCMWNLLDQADLFVDAAQVYLAAHAANLSNAATVPTAQLISTMQKAVALYANMETTNMDEFNL